MPIYARFQQYIKYQRSLQSIIHLISVSSQLAKTRLRSKKFGTHIYISHWFVTHHKLQLITFTISYHTHYSGSNECLLGQHCINLE